MSSEKVTRIVTVTNPAGIHIRAAMLIAELVNRFEAEVALTKADERVVATSVLQITTLGACPGEQLLIEATGADAQQVLDELTKLFADNFGEDEQNTDENISSAENPN